MTQFTSIGPFRYHIPDSAPFYETRMSLLWLAEALDANHRPMGEKVVLKVARLKEEQFSLANQRAIDNEERWLRRLNHPGIVKLRPIAQDGVTRADQAIYRARSTLPGNPWFVVTDYLPGGTLQSLVEERKKLSTGLALQIARSLAGALAYCHAQDCVHRDFKPQNVIFAETPAARQLTAKSQPILIDFGIANEQGDQQLVAGTRPWLPPECEQALRVGEKLPAAPSMDIYALGLTLYFMLTGKRPPQAMPGLVTQLRVDAATLVDIAAHQRSALATGINQIIAQTIADEPAARLTAQQVVEQIDQLRPGPAKQPLRRLRQPWVWLGGVATAAMLGLALIYGPGNRLNRTPPAGPALSAATLTAVVGTAVADSLTTIALAAVVPTETATPTPLPTRTPQLVATDTERPTLAPTATDTPRTTPLPVTAPQVATQVVAPTTAIAATQPLLPTATLAPSPTATATNTPTPAPPVVIGLTAPPDGGVVSGPTAFQWSISNPNTQTTFYRLLIWPVGQPNAAVEIKREAATITSTNVDLNSAPGGTVLINNGSYNWQIQLINPAGGPLVRSGVGQFTYLAPTPTPAPTEPPAQQQENNNNNDNNQGDSSSSDDKPAGGP